MLPSGRPKKRYLGSDRQARTTLIGVLVLGGICLALILSSAIVAFFR